MPSDITRNSDDLLQGYGPPVMQQGRVILDRDFNALEQTLAGSIEADALDIIGPCGTPDNGFEISIQEASPPAELWHPILDEESPPASVKDFYVGPGTMYVGGQRTELPAHDSGKSAPLFYSYFDQPDWLHPDVPGTQPDDEAISLVLREQEVSAVEDPDLLDVALGGPDTTQRLRLMRQIERIEGKTCSAPAAWWLQRGFKFEPRTMRLVPQAQLKISFVNTQKKTNPCDPVDSGGYLGAYNQLLRLTVRNLPSSSGAMTPTLIWGYDNASFIYRVTPLDSTTLQLAQAPVDVFHQPQKGQVVEILRMTSVLAKDWNNLDKSKPIIRCVAEPTGPIFTIGTSYQPTQGGEGGGTVVLGQPLSGDYMKEQFLFLRVWESQAAISLTSGIKVELKDSRSMSTGLQAQFSVPADAGTNNALPDGAFWMVAARPSTPQAVYPERFLEAAQLPDGPSQWLCPLAVIHWKDLKPIHDCREKFSNLVCLTKRERACCCRVTVGDGHHTFGDFTSINTAIAKLPPEGGEVCVLAGRYCEAVVINRSDVIIHGCGHETRIASPSLAAKPGTNNGAVITIQDVERVELRSFVIEAASKDAGVLITSTAKDLRLKEVIVVTTDQSAVHAPGDSFGMERCTLIVAGALTAQPIVYAEGVGVYLTENWFGLYSRSILPSLVLTDLGSVQVAATFVDGIQIGGSSEDVEICDNEIFGGSGNGITLGSLVTSGSNSVVAGSLSNVHIEDNVIGNMGLAGIGPVLLRDLSLKAESSSIGRIEVVSISGLFIVGNQLSYCPESPFKPSNTSNAYTTAAICLPDVAELVVRDNEITSPGDWAVAGSPISGIYLQHGEGIEISRNRIIDTRTSGVAVQSAEPPTSAGIYIQVVTPPATSADGAFDTGVPAMHVHGNEVCVRAGLALYAAGFGAFSICDNQFSTAGILSVGNDKVHAAATVYIVNTGTPLDLRSLLLAVFEELDAVLASTISNPLLEDIVIILIIIIVLWLAILELAVVAAVLDINIAALQSLHKQIASAIGIGPGPVVFSQNRVALTSARARASTSVYIATFDELGFHDNQCFLQGVKGAVDCDAFLQGITTRVTSSRFQEQFGSVKLGCFAVGLLANISSLNIVPNWMVSSLGLQSYKIGDLPPAL